MPNDDDTLELAGIKLADAQPKTMEQRLAKMEAKMGTLQAQNEKLEAELAEQARKRDEGLQVFKSDHLSENERWKRMFSEGGLLG